MKDIYDEEIERLTGRQEAIWRSWEAGDALFAFCTMDGKPIHHGPACGCLTQIKVDPAMVAVGPDGVDEDITEKIRADERIPKCPGDIMDSDLPIFAEWQRRLDRRWNRPHHRVTTAQKRDEEDYDG